VCRCRRSPPGLAAHRDPLSNLILEGRFGPKDVIPVSVAGGEFSFGRVVH
jgi:hypothetical protein